MSEAGHAPLRATIAALLVSSASDPTLRELVKQLELVPPGGMAHLDYEIAHSLAAELLALLERDRDQALLELDRRRYRFLRELAVRRDDPLLPGGLARFVRVLDQTGDAGTFDFMVDQALAELPPE